MTHTFSIDGMTCSGCATTVLKALKAVTHIQDVKIDLKESKAEVIMEQHVPLSQLQEALQPWPGYQILENNQSPNTRKSATDFWQDFSAWKRASLNTLNCLVGCSIGDFGMVIFLQAYYPTTSMAIQMVLATIAGLITSIFLETILLHTREKFDWGLALQTAFGMSFISMITMELVMNATDFMMTGGKAAFGNPLYWTALLAAMGTGFLAPLPYNYYKLKKFNRACH